MGGVRGAPAVATSLVQLGHREDASRGLTVAKWFYSIGFLFWVILTWCMRDFSHDWLTNNISTFKYCKRPGIENVCSGKQVALRFSLGNCLFFAGHTLLLAGLRSARDPRIGLATGLWFWKLLLWFGSIVGAFFMPPQSILKYGEVARYGSGVFLIFQVVELVDFIYTVNERLLERDDGCARASIVGGSLTAVCLSIAAIGVAYHFYVPSTSCHLNIFFITWSLVMGVLMVALLFLPERAATAGLLTSGAVFLYCSYVLLSALNSLPAGYHCLKGGNQISNNWIQIVGLILALLAICYSTMSTSTSDMFSTARGLDMDDDEGLTYRPDFFHLIYTLASMYIAMLFTNWELSSSPSRFELDRGWKSVWVKMGSKWLCEVLYCWTVIAPAIFGDRHFGR